MFPACAMDETTVDLVLGGLLDRDLLVRRGRSQPQVAEEDRVVREDLGLLYLAGLEDRVSGVGIADHGVRGDVAPYVDPAGVPRSEGAREKSDAPGDPFQVEG